MTSAQGTDLPITKLECPRYGDDGIVCGKEPIVPCPKCLLVAVRSPPPPGREAFYLLFLSLLIGF